MSQTSSPRDLVRSSPRYAGYDKTLSKEISLAVASIIAESKLYKDEDEPEPEQIKKKSEVTLVSNSVQSDSYENNKKTSSTPTTEPNNEENSKDKKKTGKKKKIKAKGSESKGLIENKSQKSIVKRGKSLNTINKSTKSKLSKSNESNDSKNHSAKSLGKRKKKDKKKGLIDMLENEAELATSNRILSALNSPHIPYVISKQGSFVDREGEEKREIPLPPSSKDMNSMESLNYINKVQTYFDQLGYERDGEPKIRVNTKLSIKHLMGTARQLIKSGEPIKCLHALVLAVHFTNNSTIIERFPLHFKSEVNGKEYKHVVLGIFVQGHFGALGMSRDPGLQDKAAVFSRLSDLILDYYRCYTESGHILKEVKIGSIVTHDPHSLEPISWKLGKINIQTAPLSVETEIEKLSRRLRSQMNLACLRCAPVMDSLFYTQHEANRFTLPLRQRSKSLAAAIRSNFVVNSSLLQSSRSKPMSNLGKTKAKTKGK